MDSNHVTRPMSDSEAAAVAQRILEDNFRPERQFATSYRDETPLPAYGSTPPVPQDDQRIVPRWAAGAAVASIGVGAGATGLGCAAWLLFKGLSLVSVPSLERFALIVIAPFAGLAVVATAVGAALAKAKARSTRNVYEGPVTQNTEINNTSNTRGLFARTRNDVS